MTHKHLGDAELDAAVVQALSRLPWHAPSRGFADRVMSRVGLPQPAAVTLYRRARAWVSEPRHALALAAAYGVSAIVAMVVVVPWLVSNLPAIGFAAELVAARASGAVREVLLAGAAWAVDIGLADRIRSLDLTGVRLWLAAAVLTIGYAGCAVGLHVLLRSPRGKHVPLQLPL